MITCTRRASSAIHATKHVTCRTKSTKIAIEATVAKLLTAGMVTKVPNPNAIVSLKELSRILGPILPSVFPSRSSIDSSTLVSSRLAYSWHSIKILSTPTANTKNGITSAIINVVFLPILEKIPTAVETEKITIRMPHTPSVNLESIASRRGFHDRNRPRAKEAYTNITR